MIAAHGVGSELASVSRGFCAALRLLIDEPVVLVDGQPVAPAHPLLPPPARAPWGVRCGLPRALTTREDLDRLLHGLEFCARYAPPARPEGALWWASGCVVVVTHAARPAGDPLLRTCLLRLGPPAAERVAVTRVRCAEPDWPRGARWLTLTGVPRDGHELVLLGPFDRGRFVTALWQIQEAGALLELGLRVAGKLTVLRYVLGRGHREGQSNGESHGPFPLELAEPDEIDEAWPWRLARPGVTDDELWRGLGPHAGFAGREPARYRAHLVGLARVAEHSGRCRLARRLRLHAQACARQGSPNLLALHASP